MNKNYKVYMHIFPNKKVYIGITQQELNQRWKNGYGYKQCQFVWKAIEKYGWDNVKHEILYTDLTKEEAEQKEIELIAFYKSNQKEHGYNVANGGNCVGSVSEKTKKKISNAHKGKCYHPGVWKGKKFNEEYRKKLSEAHIGKNIGHEVTKETRNKISKKLKGHIVSLETKKKIGKPVLCVETGIIYYSAREANNKTGISYKNISSVCNKKRKTTGGYHWEFI